MNEKKPIEIPLRYVIITVLAIIVIAFIIDTISLHGKNAFEVEEYNGEDYYIYTDRRIYRKA